MSFTITLSMVKWSGLALFVLSFFALFAGSMPDNEGSRFWTSMRYVVFPLMIFWFALFLGRGLWK